jgi:hypothetical protein
MGEAGAMAKPRTGTEHHYHSSEVDDGTRSVELMRTTARLAGQ